MASNYQEFVTTVKLNSEDAKNKLEQLRRDTERWIKERDQLINSGGSSKSINDLTKKITQAEKSMVSLEKQAHNVIETIDNMDAASLEQLQQAEKMLNAEMRKTPQNTQYFQDLTDKLQQVKTQIAGIREQTKQNFNEQKQLNDEIANMNNVLANINTSTLSQLSQAESTLKQQMRDAVPDSAEYQKAAASLGQVQSRIKEINDAQKETVRQNGRYAAKTASSTAGIIFATRNFFPHTRLTPTQKISTDPIRDRYDTARGVISGASSRASRVTPPSNRKTGIAENPQPFPMEEVITATMMKSSTDFTARVA